MVPLKKRLGRLPGAPPALQGEPDRKRPRVDQLIDSCRTSTTLSARNPETTTTAAAPQRIHSHSSPNISRSSSPMGNSVASAQDVAFADAEEDSDEPPQQQTTTLLEGAIQQFFLQKPVTEEERKEKDPELRAKLESILSKMEKPGAKDAYASHLKQKRNAKLQKQNQSKEHVRKINEEAVFRGVPRAYQMKLLKHASKTNTIVHLGTGMGKTLIAILLIQQTLTKKQQLLSDEKTREPDAVGSKAKQKNKVVFLVPSVALAIQQTTTLEANLPFVIGTGYNSTLKSEKSRQKLSECDILIATHGAYLDLLLHYSDLFSLRTVSLLVIDECHNAIGKSPYATIMRDFYHTLATDDRPRVLGLTASPLINAKKNCPDDDLAEKLRDLETCLDSTIIPLTSLGLDPEDVNKLLNKEVQEETILFESYLSQEAGSGNPVTTVTESLLTRGLHPRREKELRCLDTLFYDLGPHITQLFVRQLLQSITQNEYEQETPSQFEAARHYLDQLAMACQVMYQQSPSKKYTPKVEALHLKLDTQLTQHPDAVGLLFVQRRITAMALNCHFQDISEQRRARVAPSNEIDSPTSGEQPQGISLQQPQNTVMDLDMSQFDDAQFEDPELEEPLEEPGQDSVLETTALPKIAETAASEPSVQPPLAAPPQQMQIDQFEDADGDPFADADYDPSEEMKSPMPLVQSPNKSDLGGGCHNDLPFSVPIKSNCLVRKPTRVFRVAGQIQNNTNEEDQGSSIRSILNKIKSGKINLLIATSVVEEGIDVSSISFVVVFDALTSLKQYVQMKGRARHSHSAFFTFEECGATTNQTPLKSVKYVEERVNGFLALREGPYLKDTSNDSSQDSDVEHEELDSDELQAIKSGQYKAAHATVTLSGAKSLLCRFALSATMDPADRSSREALKAHLPSFDFDTNTLKIPSHLATFESIQSVSLPDSYKDRNKKDRESLVSLQACVRLHKNGLLNERLLPLNDSDIQERLLSSRLEARSCPPTKANVLKPILAKPNGEMVLYLYPIEMGGSEYCSALKRFNPANRRLGVLSWTPLKGIPCFEYSLSNYGMVSCQIGKAAEQRCSDEEMILVSNFFQLIWNARWKRRTREDFFQVSEKSRSTFAYRIVCLDATNCVDWEHMKELIAESRRSHDERIDAVRTIDGTQTPFRPRLWCPIYSNERVVYVVNGPSGLTCDAAFPHECEDDERIKTFKDFYHYRHGTLVSDDCPLFEATRQWNLPSCGWSESHADISPLKKVDLPQQACVEPILADVAMSFLTLLLPQFCYHMERFLTTSSFLDHIRVTVPTLSRLLDQIPLSKVLEALTAKSCHPHSNYEKLEWLGDGVLKLAQTDALINSTELGEWVRRLPEGYLNQARSHLGSNSNLQNACKNLNLDAFIHIDALSRGVWSPSTMRLVKPDGTELRSEAHEGPSGKVCADVMESLIGLVYLHFGYQSALASCDALNLTVTHKPDEFLSHVNQQYDGDNSRLQTVKCFTGYKSFHRKFLVEEALTHPTRLYSTSNNCSYQRLEWIGDAVLCLAVRSWIFKHKLGLDLGDMVLLEAALVCNETLAFLSLHAGLPQHMMHGDQTLPDRIEKYSFSVKERGLGLWGTNPPKCVSDIVESLMGAVHIDGGFEAGQKCVLFVLGEILKLVKDASDEELERFCCYPKRNILSEMGSLAQLEETQDASERPVSILKLLDEPILTVPGPVPSSSSNRVCSFVWEFLKDNDDVMERLRALKKKTQQNTDS